MPGTQLLGCQYSYFCTRTASKVSTAGARLLNVDVGERKLLDERADVGTAGPAIRQHTSAYVSIRQHTMRARMLAPPGLPAHYPCVSACNIRAAHPHSLATTQQTDMRNAAVTLT